MTALARWQQFSLAAKNAVGKVHRDQLPASVP